MVTNLISITNNFDQKTAEEFLEPILNQINLKPIYQTLSGDDEEGIAIYTLVFKLVLKNLDKQITRDSQAYEDLLFDLRETFDENFDDPFTNFSTIFTDDHIIITIYTTI